MALVASPGLFLIAYWLAPGSVDFLAGCMAAGTALNGLTLTWYAIGTGSARSLALFEALPKFLGVVAAGILVAQTGQLLLFPLAVGSIAILCMALFLAHDLMVSAKPSRPPEVRIHANSLAIEVVAGTYSMGAPGLVAMSSSPLGVAMFGSAHRLTGFGSVAIAALSNSLQGWVAEASTDSRFTSRCFVSLGFHGILGTTGLLVLTGFGPQLTSIIFGSHLQSDRMTTGAFGVFFLFWSLEAVTSRHVLGTLGKTRPLLAATAVGSVTGVIAVAVATPHFGPPGAAVSVAGAVALTFFIELWFCARELRRLRSSAAATSL